MENCDVLVIGGGPVGGITAVHAKMRALLADRGMEVVILEKRTTYSREHTVHLDREVLKKMAFKAQNVAAEKLELLKEYHALLDEIGGNRPIQLIESMVSEFADKIDVEINRGAEFSVYDPDRTGKVEGRTLEALIDEYKPRVVIAAGGARCPASKEVFGEDQYAEQVGMSYFLKAKFSVPDKRSLSSSLKLPAATSVGGFVSPPWFSRNQDENGLYRGQAFMTVSDEDMKFIEEYRDIDGQKLGSYRNPITFEKLDGLNVTSKLSNKLRKARVFTEDYFSDLNAKHVRFTAIRTTGYRSSEYARENYSGAAVIKVGDASAGVPYQRSLCGSYLAVPHVTKAIEEILEGTNEDKAVALSKMTSHVDSIWKWELFVAKVKYFFLNLLDHIIAFFSFLRDLTSKNENIVETKEREFARIVDEIEKIQNGDISYEGKRPRSLRPNRRLRSELNPRGIPEIEYRLKKLEQLRQGADLKGIEMLIGALRNRYDEIKLAREDVSSEASVDSEISIDNNKRKPIRFHAIEEVFSEGKDGSSKKWRLGGRLKDLFQETSLKLAVENTTS
ncbi:MAG: hypothetical protein S4CHLAM20_09420 [Chlamydiia bacterium]|nr:hypothetical protein [Chlamydiia bacterium]